MHISQKLLLNLLNLFNFLPTTKVQHKLIVFEV